jgi:tRNA pseudouridine38-40 synthase
MRIIRLVVSYDGTDFCGWQRQLGDRTVQGELEDALARLAGKRIPIVGAGRTDAGVHAVGQVASFRTALRLGEAELLRALNSLLPRDVRVSSVQTAPPGFDARKSARSKIYKYRIYCGPQVHPFLFRYVLHWPGRLDFKKMAEAAKLFKRKADFTAFSSNRLLQPVRRVMRSDLKKKGREIVYTIEADGYLRYMVRAIVGTLLEVGRCRVEPRAIEDLFKQKKRSLASPTAPAKGLCLIKVVY